VNRISDIRPFATGARDSREISAKYWSERRDAPHDGHWRIGRVSSGVAQGATLTGASAGMWRKSISCTLAGIMITRE
jgi:hypothetical protein